MHGGIHDRLACRIEGGGVHQERKGRRMPPPPLCCERIKALKGTLSLYKVKATLNLSFYFFVPNHILSQKDLKKRQFKHFMHIFRVSMDVNVVFIFYFLIDTSFC